MRDLTADVMLFHSEFKMIPRRQGGSDGGVLTDTLSKLTTQPTQVALEDGMEYAYDPFGKRISKTLTKDEIGTDCANNTCPKTTYYVYDKEQIIAEYDSNGAVIRKYTYGRGIDEPLALEKDNQTFYYHNDGLGSITSLTDANGTVVHTYNYEAFGNITINGTIKQPFTFTAREYDAETGMYFYRARYYDPKAGRFITKDPIGCKGGYNLYTYVLNNPINKIDPLGLAGCGPCGTHIPDPWDLKLCCDEHDKCYGEDGNCALKPRQDCDADFCSCMLDKQCAKVPNEQREACNSRAQLYCFLVKALGWLFYTPCNCPEVFP